MKALKPHPESIMRRFTGAVEWQETGTGKVAVLALTPEYATIVGKSDRPFHRYQVNQVFHLPVRSADQLHPFDVATLQAAQTHPDAPDAFGELKDRTPRPARTKSRSPAAPIAAAA